MEYSETTYEEYEEYEGPIPSHADFEKLKKVDPSFPARVMTQFESESHHRRVMEVVLTVANILLAGGAQVTSLVVVLAAFALAAFLGLYVHPAAGTIVGLGEVYAIGKLFLVEFAKQKVDAPPQGKQKNKSPGVKKKKQARGRNGKQKG